nr:hypothetical protein [Tanacetum cinerariifolium]
MCEMACQIIQKKQEEKRIKEEQAAKAQNSKIPGDEHLNTIPATESDEFINSYVENLVPNLSESEGKNGYDVLACFTTFLNILFEADYKSGSSDYQSCSDEDFPEEIFLNPLFEEEIISIRIDHHHFNAESDLIESLLNRDSSIISSYLKIDSLHDVLAGELTLLKTIPPGIDETDCYHEEDIRLIERLLYDNSSPRPPEEFVFENSNADIESFFPSPIPNEDSDTFMEEIDLSFNLDDLVPPGVEEDDDDSEKDMLIHEELLDNYSLSLPVIELFYFDIPSFSRPPVKLPDGNTRILNIKIIGDISYQKVPMPRLMITLVSNQEKSLDLLSYRGLKIFKVSAKCLMMIHGKNIPTLDVPLFHFYPLINSSMCGISLLHLTGSQPMLKSSYKAEASVIISIPPLVRGVADVVVEIKGTADKARMFQEERSLHGIISPVNEIKKKDKIRAKPGKNGKRGKAQKCQISVTIKKAEKTKKIQSKGTKNANLEDVFHSRKFTRTGIAILLTTTQRAETATFSKQLCPRIDYAITSITLKGCFCQTSNLATQQGLTL